METASVIPIESAHNSLLLVTKEDIDTLKRQRELLKKFISSQLVEGIDNDYAVIPGTKKKSLLKPGAEKLKMLFGLGVSFACVKETIDRIDNYAEITYRCSVYSLRNPSVVIAECEGGISSWEKKYKTRTVWVNNQKTEEDTKVCDILNTLKKMCQKRALVGAIIIATGASDFFSQDMEDAEDIIQDSGRPEPKRASGVVPRAGAAKSQDQTNSPRQNGHAPVQPVSGGFASFGEKAEDPVRTRDEIIAEVVATGKAMSMNVPALQSRCLKETGKASGDLSPPELESFLKKLKEELARGGK